MRRFRLHLALILCAMSLVGVACDDPPAKSGPKIDVDAESSALDEKVDRVRDEADQRVASPADASTEPETD